VFVDLSIDTGFDLFTDGCLPEMPTDADRNCVSEADDITFMNLGFCGGGRSEDISPHDCMGMALPPQDF
jgi:hypothetical protein